MSTESPSFDCFACSGSLAILGQLGHLVWFRCIDCGLEQTHTLEMFEEVHNG